MDSCEKCFCKLKDPEVSAVYAMAMGQGPLTVSNSCACFNQSIRRLYRQDECAPIEQLVRPRQRHETADDGDGMSGPESGESAAPKIDKRKNQV
ncbi:MAG: hypothetical protein PVG46_02905 [Desulfobacterales bacterium]